MKKIVIASLRENAGKTSVVVGLSENLDGTVGYIKPFGDRMLYSKKRLWDQDAALMTYLYSMPERPDDMSIGFDHSKLRYMYTEESIRQKVCTLADTASQQKDILFVEGGKSISYGESVHLNALDLARYLNAGLIIIAGGHDDAILDDILFLKNKVSVGDITIDGIVVNKVRDKEEFESTYLQDIQKTGLPVLGIIPYCRDLTYFTLKFLADKLFAKVLTGEDGLDRTIKNIFIGAMSGSTAVQKPLFKKEAKLIITGGDRTDMILAAVESNAAGIILTNNIIPPSNVIARVEESGTPMLLVTTDTYQTERQIENMVPLMTVDDVQRRELLKNIVKENVNYAALK